MFLGLALQDALNKALALLATRMHQHDMYINSALSANEHQSVDYIVDQNSTPHYRP
jgi:hypothetical protein